MEEILIIEDDELLNDGLCFNLQKAGLCPVPAYNLKQARTVWTDRTGLYIFWMSICPTETVFGLRRKYAGKSFAPIVFLTAHDMDEDMMRGFDAGADDYITKPLMSGSSSREFRLF